MEKIEFQNSKKTVSKKIKIHLICFLIIIATALVFMCINSYLQIHKTCGNGDIISFHRPSKEFSKVAILDFHQFPHWNPYYFAGAPHWGNAQYMVFSFPVLLTIISPTVTFAANLIILFNILFAGIFTYLLIISFNLKSRYGLLGSVIYIFNGFSMFMIRACGGDRWDVYIWLPFVMFFFRKAYKDNKNSIIYATVTGIGLAGAFHAGDPSFFLPIMLFAGTFAAFNILLNFKKNIKKTIIISIIVFIVMTGLMAIKVFPLLEYSKVSNKASGGFSYEESKGTHLEINNIKDLIRIPQVLISSHSRDPHFRKDVEIEDSWISYPINIGLIAFILLLFSLGKIKNKNVMFYWLMMVLLFLIGTGSPLYYILWKFIPGFKMQHHVVRLLVYTALASAVLVAYGASHMFKIIEDAINNKRNRKYLKYVSIAIILLILLQLGFFMKIKNPERPYRDIEKEFESNELWQELSQKEGIFRIHNLNTKSIGGYSTAYAVFNKVQILYGYNNVWITEYFNVHLAVSHNYPEKFYGMLNTKYIYSNIELNRTDLKFVKKFNECPNCMEDENVDQGIDGPYLYENKLFLPRAYTVDNAILVVGEEQAAKNLMYGLMLDSNFDPKNTVVILSKHTSINSYNIDFLEKFNAIFLTEGSIDQSSATLLQDYKGRGGKLFPDVTEEKFALTEEDIGTLWKSFDGNYTKMEIPYFSPNKINVNTENKKGWLVISDKFFMFEGWKSISNQGQKEIHRANGMSSAVFLSGNEEYVEFYYSSSSFRIGAIISTITLLTALSYLAFWLVRKRQKRK